MTKLFAFAFFCAGCIGVATHIASGVHVMPWGWVAFALSNAAWFGLVVLGQNVIASRTGKR